jgi:hypothetical protein
VTNTWERQLTGGKIYFGSWFQSMWWSKGAHFMAAWNHSVWQRKEPGPDRSFFFFFFNVCFLFFVLRYRGLNSGTIPWATPPALFCEGFFQDRVLWIFCPGWLWTAIIHISASWVGRITGVSHLCLARYIFLGHVPSDSLLPTRPHLLKFHPHPTVYFESVSGLIQSWSQSSWSNHFLKSHLWARLHGDQTFRTCTFWREHFYPNYNTFEGFFVRNL